MSRLEQHFTEYGVSGEQLADFIYHASLTPSYKEGCLGAPDVPIENLEHVDNYYDRENNYLLYYIIKFEEQLYKLTLFFDSYGSQFGTGNITWRDYAEVNAVSKTIIDYE